MRTMLSATALTFTLATGAQAQEILSAGALFAGSTQSRASATSSTPVGIFDNAGKWIGQAVNDCGVMLLGGRSCGIAANVENNQPYNCAVTVSPNNGAARGVLELRNSSGTSLTNVELR